MDMTVHTLKNYEKALKENYLPVWENQLNIEPSAFLSKIKDEPLVADKIVAAAPFGISGGFGFGAEGAPTPKAGNVPFERFESRAKDMYVDICISAKAVRLTGSGGAMANALDTEVKGAYNAAKWNVGRSLFGNGMGVLTNCEGVTGGNTITVESTKFLIEGLIVDVYATGANVGDAPQADGKGLRIKSIDRMNKKVTFYGASVTLQAGFITVQNSYGLEITGIGTIFDDEIETIYGVSKEENPIIKPTVVDANKDITDSVITKALRESQDVKGSKVNMLLCGDAAYDTYVDYLRANNIRVEERSHTIQGGFKAIKFLFADREIDVVNERFVPDNEMWGIDGSAFKFHKQKWAFADLQGGGIFNLMEGHSIYRALLANYGELMCNNPGGCVRIANCV